MAGPSRSTQLTGSTARPYCCSIRAASRSVSGSSGWVLFSKMT